MKLKISTDNVTQDGLLYILLIELENKQLVKVGVTCRDKIEDRVSEILVSIWKKYRVFPYCYPKRFRKTKDVFSKEAILHKALDEFRYSTEHQFSGSTEIFEVELDEVTKLYEQLLLEGNLDDTSCPNE